MASFKVDENLPAEVAHILSAAGHDATTVLQQRLHGQQDPVIETVCAWEKRALVTLDLDFADIRNYPPADCFGIVVLRLFRCDKSRIIHCVQRLLPLLDSEPLAGTLWIVDDHRVRIRS